MANIAVIHKDIENFPSLREAMTVNLEAIHKQKTLIGIFKHELVDQKEKIEIAKELNLPPHSFKLRLKTIERQINDAEKCVLAYESGYLEIPKLGDDLEIDKSQNDWGWKFTFDGRTPLRVLQAVKEADEKGLFKKIVVFQPQSRRDPIVAGKIGNLYFFITSYK